MVAGIDAPRVNCLPWVEGFTERALVPVGYPNDLAP